VSIDIDEFEEKSEAELADMTNGERVLRFLAHNDDRAFKPAEIAEQTGVNKNSIGNVLGRLEDRALVRHKGPYWAITDDEQRLASFSDYFQTTSALNERLGEEDPEEWAAHAPDEPHPNADREGEETDEVR
jgi:transcription initiation factor IIE alpha subunit